MNPMAIHPLDNAVCTPSRNLLARRLELSFWLLLLIVCNHSLWNGQVAEQFIFVPDLVKGGEWSRTFLSTFTHVSKYHLLLDATAFLLLWNGLEEKRFWGRWVYFVGCWAGSIIVPLALSTQVYERGICGLSGVAHGLFAITALEMLFYRETKEARTVGRYLFVAVLAKVFWELIPGANLMSRLHLGDVGVPIVTSHLGGIVGGCIAFGVLLFLKREKSLDGRKGVS